MNYGREYEGIARTETLGEASGTAEMRPGLEVHPSKEILTYHIPALPGVSLYLRRCLESMQVASKCRELLQPFGRRMRDCPSYRECLKSVTGGMRADPRRQDYWRTMTTRSGPRSRTRIAVASRKNERKIGSRVDERKKADVVRRRSRRSHCGDIAQSRKRRR